MALRSLKLVNFRNFDELFIEAGEGLHLLTGPNGSGKTSVLEALYFLCFSKSFRTNSDLDMLKEGEGHFQARAEFSRNGEKVDIQGNVVKGRGKKIIRNGVPLERLSDLVSVQPLVLQSPEDIRITLGPSREKRLYFNRLISQLRPSYLDDILQYNRLIKQRNALLKTMKQSGVTAYSLQLEIYDGQLSELYFRIYDGRRTFIGAFEQVFRQFYGEFYPEEGHIEPEIRYLPSVEGKDSAEFSEIYREKSRSRCTSEIALSRTLLGANYDRIHFLREGRSLETSGSQGEHKLWMIMMKLSEGRMLEERAGDDVLYLFDDIFGELDIRRTSEVIARVGRYRQVFITGTDLNDIRRHGLDVDSKAVKILNFT